MGSSKEREVECGNLINALSEPALLLKILNIVDLNSAGQMVGCLARLRGFPGNPVVICGWKPALGANYIHFGSYR